jgi:6-pyruvoyltetrahydropterin/6-carboxytetrahydropterin synthase
MAMRIYREYQLKFYLNARRYMIHSGLRGETRPQTWEFRLNVRVGRGAFIPFRTFEEAINGFLSKYQDKLMNEVEPFDEFLPTLENVSVCFAREFHEIIRKLGGVLVRLETSKSPTRSYILDLENMEDEKTQEVEDQILSQVVDVVLDRLMEGVNEDSEGVTP